MMIYRGNKKEWNEFVAANAEDGGVLQSWEWGEFQESLGRRIWRLGFGEKQIEAVCLLIEHRLPFGFKYLYAPRGPVINIKHPALNIQHIVQQLSEFCRGQGALFLRVEPPYSLDQCSMLNVRSVHAVQPQQTLRINLTKSENELFAAMHQKTRYNIRLAEKHSIRVISNQGLVTSSSFDSFWSLMQETAKRDGFKLHSQKHYRNLLGLPYCLMLTAYYKQMPLATVLVAFFGTTAYYLHGGSSSVHRDMKAPNLLQWEIMREAKRRGCTTYDLWGIDEKRWTGVTRFKRGFAPDTPMTMYAGTFDVPARSLLYYMYRVWKFFR